MPSNSRRGGLRVLVAGAAGLLLPLAGAVAGASPGAGPGAGRLGTVAASPEWQWLPGERPDLAPAGLPDFSQCRRGWSQNASAPGRPPQWTYAGPVALAAALWWLDSRAEPGGIAPPRASDGHGLVTAYPVFGRARDDHDPGNLPLLVEDLALRAGTDGRGGTKPERGTSWTRLRDALGDYLAARRLATLYRVEVDDRPQAAWLRPRQAAGAAFVLALGVWEQQEAGWKRVGGHYAGLAGLSAPRAGEPDWLALADPLADQAALGGAGRALPPGPDLHSCRLAPAAHDDPALLSHDGYPLAEASLPNGALILRGYFGLDAQGEAAAFAGQNGLELAAEHRGDWQGGAVVMALDAALAIVPDPQLLPATATPAASPTSPSTPTAAVSTATPLPSSTSAGDATITPPPSTATATRGAEIPPFTPGDEGSPRPLWLPWLAPGADWVALPDPAAPKRRRPLPRGGSPWAVP